MSHHVLGISAFYHDSAAAIVRDGEIVAAAQEERFTRKKHDSGFPGNAVLYCLKEAGVGVKELSCVVFYDKPLVKFERLLETYLTYAPRGVSSFVTSMPVWIKEKLFLKGLIRRELAKIGQCKVQELPKLMFTEHHQAHAASAFYPSPFKRAAVLCLDGVGEWATTSAWLGEDRTLRPLWQINFPHSLGLLYSAFTYHAGFKVNSGEYKLMGLAPYGEPKYVDVILKHLIDLKDDGTFHLNMEYFDYATGLKMTNRKFDALFGKPPRKSEGEITQREMDLAQSIQAVTEEVVLRLVRTLHQETGEKKLCLAGGVALNCVANGRVLREGPFEDMWIQPAAGDAGGALGAALIAWHQHFEGNRQTGNRDAMRGAYLGPRFTDTEIREYLNRIGANYERLEEVELLQRVAEQLKQENVVGWFHGRMEFGPRALGARSIIGDARSTRMQSVMNLKIKYRESFRPFAPSVLAERVSDYFELNRPSPYMLLVASVKEILRLPTTSEQERMFGIQKLNMQRSTIPAITHVDYSARVQTVHRDTNPRYYDMIRCFEKLTGCGVIINTSFNVRGEPIVGTPEDAYQCFMRTEMDCLVLENYLLLKQNQQKCETDDSWKREFELD